MKKFITTVLLIFIFSVFCEARDFKNVDKYARSVKKSSDYRQLAKKLVKPFTQEVDKARAIFVWIAHNIEYDIRKAKKNRKSKITGRNKREIERKRQRIRLKKVQKAYISGKGVCEEYSLLFNEMCKAVGLKSEYIVGYARFSPKEIGKKPNSINHAWNAVKINGSWKLVDVTWAAGIVDLKKSTFTKDFSDFFFLTDPELFILNHYPKNPKWQLLNKRIDKRKFSSFPHIHSIFYKYGVKNFTPRSAFISSKNKKNNVITLQLKNTNNKIGIYSGKKLLKKKYEVSETGKVEVKIPSSIRRNKRIIIGIVKDKNLFPIIEYRGS